MEENISKFTYMQIGRIYKVYCEIKMATESHTNKIFDAHTIQCSLPTDHNPHTEIISTSVFQLFHNSDHFAFKSID